jgi:PAS domain S-box-containing protein
MHASLPKQPGTPDTSDAPISWGERLAVWPVAAFALAIVLLLFFETSASFEHPRLLLSLNVLSTLVSLAIAAVAGRSFMVTGHPALLLLGCGALMWGLFGTVGPSVVIMGLAYNQLQSNTLATLHATCGWLSAMLHLTATTVACKSPPSLAAPRHWLAAAYLSSLALVAIVAVATIYGRIPLFFSPDLGGTSIRQMVLGSAIAMFLLAAIMLHLISRQRAFPFARWYSLALFLFAIGLVGILFQRIHGSPVEWAGRSAISLGGLYLLRAVFQISHECSPCLITWEQIVDGPVWQWAMATAIAVVSAAAAMVIRLYFLPESGAALASMTFVPAIMLASFLGGYRAGLLTTIFSVALIFSSLQEPVGQTAPHGAVPLPVDMFLLVSGLMIALAARGLQRSESRAVLAETMDAAATEQKRLLDLLKINEERVAHVIAEQQLLETSMQEQKTNFHNLVETTTDLIVVASFAGDILFSNTHFKKRLEYSQEELETIHLLELHPPEMRQEAEAIVKAMLCGEQEICPLPILTKSGRLVPVETRAWIGKWNGQDCLVGFIKDLSIELEAQQRFERLFHSNPVPMALLTWPDRRLVDVNDAFLTISGIPKQDVIGKQPRELGLFREQPEDAEMLIEAIVRQGRFSNIELRVIGKHGNVIVGLFSGELISNQGMDYLLATMIDITERKWMEETLRIRDATLTAIIENQPGLLWLKDPESRFLAVNSQFARMCGLQRPEDIVGKTDLDVWPLELADKYRTDDQMIIQSNQPLMVEELVSDQGEMKWFETFKTPIFDDWGKVIGTTGYARDITARKQTEAALQRATDTAFAAVVAQNKLLSTVAHEFRTPLMLLQSSLEILDRYSDRLSEAKRSMQQQRIRSAARQLIGLANTVLTYTRMEKDAVKGPSVSCDIDIGRLCRVIAEETQAAWAEEHRFEITIGFEEASLVLDPVLFRRILENLLTNAFRYTPPSRAVFFKVNRDCDWLCLTIADEGIGIEEEDQPHVFELLFRGRNVGQSRGMGMGLSIVSESVQQMEGTITLHSAIGLGTTFVVHLPWREVSERS